METLLIVFYFKVGNQKRIHKIVAGSWIHAYTELERKYPKSQIVEVFVPRTSAAVSQVK